MDVLTGFEVNQYTVTICQSGNIEINQEDPSNPGGHSVFFTPEQLPLLISHLKKVNKVVNDAMV